MTEEHIMHVLARLDVRLGKAEAEIREIKREMAELKASVATS